MPRRKRLRRSAMSSMETVLTTKQSRDCRQVRKSFMQVKNGPIAFRGKHDGHSINSHHRQNNCGPKLMGYRPGHRSVRRSFRPKRKNGTVSHGKYMMDRHKLWQTSYCVLRFVRNCMPPTEKS